MPVTSFDHVAIPIDDEKRMIAFYSSLGFEISKLNNLIYAVQFGENKIHFHLRDKWEDSAFKLRGPSAAPGCGDFCFVWNGSLESVFSVLEDNRIPVIDGPMNNIGGRDSGKKIGTSVYVRDPDKNLLEFIVYE